MGRLSTSQQVRERAAECRARADHLILRPDAAAWLELADTWDHLADAMEASARDEGVEWDRTGLSEQRIESGWEGTNIIDAPLKTGPRDPERSDG